MNGTNLIREPGANIYNRTSHHFSGFKFGIEEHHHHHPGAFSEQKEAIEGDEIGGNQLLTMQDYGDNSRDETESAPKGFKKRSWQGSEDAILRGLVNVHGPRDWNYIARHLQGRSAKQCCERWHNYLKPNIKKDAWRPEEDKLILEYHHAFCNKWSKIAEFLPGRTGNAVKNRFYCLMRRDRKSGGVGLMVQPMTGVPPTPHDAHALAAAAVGGHHSHSQQHHSSVQAPSSHHHHHHHLQQSQQHNNHHHHHHPSSSMPSQQNHSSGNGGQIAQRDQYLQHPQLAHEPPPPQPPPSSSSLSFPTIQGMLGSGSFPSLQSPPTVPGSNQYQMGGGNNGGGGGGGGGGQDMNQFLSNWVPYASQMQQNGMFYGGQQQQQQQQIQQQQHHQQQPSPTFGFGDSIPLSSPGQHPISASPLPFYTATSSSSSMYTDGHFPSSASSSSSTSLPSQANAFGGGMTASSQSQQHMHIPQSSSFHAWVPGAGQPPEIGGIHQYHHNMVGSTPTIQQIHFPLRSKSPATSSAAANIESGANNGSSGGNGEDESSSPSPTPPSSEAVKVEKTDDNGKGGINEEKEGVKTENNDEGAQQPIHDEVGGGIYDGAGHCKEEEDLDLNSLASGGPVLVGDASVEAGEGEEEEEEGGGGAKSEK